MLSSQAVVATMKVHMLSHVTLHSVDDPRGSFIASSPDNDHIARSHVISSCVPHHVPVFCDLYESLQLFDVGCFCVGVQCLVVKLYP